MRNHGSNADGSPPMRSPLLPPRIFVHLPGGWWSSGVRTLGYPKLNAWHLMVGMNVWGLAYMTLFMFLIPGGGGYDAVGFCMHHPDIAWDIFLFCCVGQSAITSSSSLSGAVS